MKHRIRRCDSRCHQAKGDRCRCLCQGAFHGISKAQNREALARGDTWLLEQNGFKKGETAYLEQMSLALEMAD